jgi:hypothetical protein
VTRLLYIAQIFMAVIFVTIDCNFYQLRVTQATLSFRYSGIPMTASSQEFSNLDTSLQKGTIGVEL